LEKILSVFPIIGNMNSMWDERYSEPGFAYGSEPNDFLVSVADRLPKGRILSLAEGQGRNAVFLASRGFEVVAVDCSPVGLEAARRLASSRGVRIATIVEDLARFQIEPNQWDGIISISCHLPPAIRKPLYRAVVRGLKPGGAFVMEAYSTSQLGRGTGGPTSTDLLVRVEDLRLELSGLRFAHLLETERDVREGKYHTGLASVVQVLAFKPEVRATSGAA
jgi:SAM-dependent methyltransferase